ncbi:glycosyltransferase family 4 protein [Paraflavisolibacter sp. H34]|uniref:glycosyltransferase family 4 protein n=1 Tax=Huijunlia imazamoxiresistens TaxID=3127457 RepID=UPI0030165652
MKRIVCTVTNDLHYDQRMIRICSSLAVAGYDVLLVGRKLKSSPPLSNKPFRQKRLSCFFEKGFLFYAEYNLRLLVYLLFRKWDLICAIDLDTITPCLLASALKGTRRLYDAHELFCEMKEVVSRPLVHRFWKAIERKTVPRFRNGYTVNTPIRDIFQKDYGVRYEVIRNIPPLRPGPQAMTEPENFIIYQGAVNEGRSFETLIPAFQWIDVPLHIYGDGNFMEEARRLVALHGLQQKVIFKGKRSPDELRTITPKALMGVTLFENRGLNNYLSLGNRFFDYLHAGIPQICVDYPAYRELNQTYRMAVLVHDLSPRALAGSINALLGDKALQKEIRQNCIAARKELNWQAEEKRLLALYAQIFAS